MFAPVVKETIRVGAAHEIGEAVARGATAALAAPAGPVYLEIPTDLLREESRVASLSPPPPRRNADVGAAAELCVAAERPLLWVGGGAKDAREGVAALASALGAPVIETYGARGVLDPAHPSWLGLPPHLPEVGALWDDADLVVAVGSDLDGMMTQNFAQPQPPHLLALNVDAADAAKNYAADVVVEGDVARTAQALADELPGRAHPPPSLTALRSKTLDRLREDEPEGTAFLAEMDEALDQSTAVFADMCIPGYWLASMHPFARPRRLAYPVGWGTLGFAFPASIGAALAQDDPVLCVCGDGGFMFAAGELAVVAQERAPLTILVVDDGGYGMLRYDQDKAGHRALRRRPGHPRLAPAGGRLRDRVRGGRGRRRSGRRAAPPAGLAGALAGGRADQPAAPAQHVPAVVPAGVESVPCPTPPTS